MRIAIPIIISVLLIIWSSIALCSEPKILKAGGTGSGLGIIRLLGESFSTLHPEVTIQVLPSLGSTGAIQAVKYGAIDFAIASRQLTKDEAPGITEHFLGESPFVFATHHETVINNITLSQIINIYNGTVRKWPDGTTIRRILRPDSDSDWKIMKNLSPGMSEALTISQNTKGLFLAITDTDAISYIERIRGSFGMSTYALILAENWNVKILSFNNIPPQNAHSDDMAYPLVKQFYLMTRKDISPLDLAFVTFIYSAQGRQILANARVNTAL